MSTEDTCWTQRSEELFLLRDMFLAKQSSEHASIAKVPVEDLIYGYLTGLERRKLGWSNYNRKRLKSIAEWLLENTPSTEFINSRWCVVYPCRKPSHINFPLAGVFFQD